ncbi:hypothetical protein [Streptomyces sp. Wh19]|uniref:hypothetical protein n=1 Tax=Streptomyces sp. Wh19 TaxID=3076629 RepID=UPI002958CADF|nr:hypothetical protein [Streptomyces sp. Wh19]MDV9199478.1 hypothetical protein [Streptomyces sp. Wh19]
MSEAFETSEISETSMASGSAAATVRLRPLSMVPEGEDEVLVGDPVTGQFITMPKVGGVVIEALRRGATAAEAAAEAEEFAGQPVDVPSFVDTLRELGFLDEGQRSQPVRSAPVQGRRWLSGLRQETVRPFFGRVAWSCYAACAVFALAVFAFRPGLFPDPSTDAFVVDDIGLGSLILIPLATVATRSMSWGTGARPVRSGCGPGSAWTGAWCSCWSSRPT